MKHIKGAKPEIYNKITTKIINMTKNSNDEKQDNEVKDMVFEYVKGYKELEEYAQNLLNFDAQETIQKLDLQHLKHHEILEEIPEEDCRIQPKKKQKIYSEPLIS